MKEGTPITPLSEAEIEDRPARLAYALDQIQLAEEVVMNAPNHEYILEGIRDGEKEKVALITDPEVVQAMKGGTSRLYTDVKQHYDGLAEQILHGHVPENYKPPFQMRNGKRIK